MGGAHELEKRLRESCCDSRCELLCAAAAGASPCITKPAAWLLPGGAMGGPLNRSPHGLSSGVSSSFSPMSGSCTSCKDRYRSNQVTERPTAPGPVICRH